MNANSHKAVTLKAFDCLVLLDVLAADWLEPHKFLIAEQAAAPDKFRDLEIVDVKGAVAGLDHVDDPHVDESGENDDHADYALKDETYTKYNHFIDIKKGPGLFDDFDGYSYRYGSASTDEYQDAADATEDSWIKFVASLQDFFTGSCKVDEGVMWYLNDSYVHAPGHRWYRGCSPAIERYSFPEERGIYASVEDESRARFPVADWMGKEGKGLPYSVFMPVDNFARYWYLRCERTFDPRALGPLLHAIHDASIPHHSAGYVGNWHQEYEDKIEERLDAWLSEPSIVQEALDLFKAWVGLDPDPPLTLTLIDRTNRNPCYNWRVDMLITWLGLHAYNSYDRVYHHFRSGFQFYEDDARQLTVKALAMSVLILCIVGELPLRKMLPEKSLIQSLHNAGKTLPFSWRRDLPGYPQRLRMVVNLLNSSFPNWQTAPFP